jgi:hypothetical protein
MPDQYWENEFDGVHAAHNTEVERAMAKFDDYEISDDERCPKCNHSPIHWRRCQAIGCDDGWIDMHEYDDPLWYDPGDLEMCEDCQGTGIEKWCPGCGANLSGVRR